MSVKYAQPIMGEEEKAAISEVLDSGIIASGPKVKAFEESFADYIGVKHGVACSNGTTALHTALSAVGIEPGDKIITTPFTFIASSNSILYCGATPLFADIDPRTFNITPESIEKLLEEHSDVKVLLIVHLYGLSCDMEQITRIVEEKELILIEDAAQAHGSEYHGKKVGSFGDAAIFSFYPTKNMTTGEGGMVVTSDERVAHKARKLINHGRLDRYYHDELGYNYRMTDIAAAIGLCQLEKLDSFNEKRRMNASYLDKALSDIDWLETPYVPEGYYHVYHQYTIKTEHRDRLSNLLQEKGIGHSIVYPFAQYEQPLYKRLGYKEGLSPTTEHISRRVLSLPIHPGLTREDLNEIAEAIREFEG